MAIVSNPRKDVPFTSFTKGRNPLEVESYSVREKIILKKRIA